MSNTNSGIGLVQALEADQLRNAFTSTTQCSTTVTSTTEETIYLIPEVAETVVTTTTTPVRPAPSLVLNNQRLPAKVALPPRKPLRGNATGVHMRPAATTIQSGVIKIAAQPIVKNCIYHVFPAGVNNGFRVGNPTILVPTTITTVTSAPVQSFIITTPTKPVQNLQDSGGQLAISQKTTCFECGRIAVIANTCDNCGKKQPEIPAGPSGSANGPNQKVLTPGPAIQKKRFYGKQLTPLVALPNSNGNVIKRTIVRRPAKRKSVDPPECLTISDDEEAMDNSTMDTSLPDANDMSQEEESEPPTPEGDGASQLNGLTNGKDAARSPVIIPPNKIKATEVIKMITYPPPPVTGGITVTTEDFHCLESGEFLNDVIIDFYLKYVMLERLSEEDKNRTHIFSSFFYGRLTNNEMRSHSPSSAHDSDNTKGTQLPLGARRHNRVKTWTRHVDIFSKDFIIVPINESAHWYLAIICYPYLYESGHEPGAAKAPATAETADAKKKNVNSENTNAAELPKVPIIGDVKKRKVQGSQKKRPCILVFDSLHGRNWSKITAVLREYLTCEWKSKKNSDRQFTRLNIKGSCPLVPQQSNYHDCGAFLLQYVDSFFATPIKDFSLPIRNLQAWFSQEVVDNKRQDLKDLILRLQGQQNGTAKTDVGAAPEDAASSGSGLAPAPMTNSPLVPGCVTPTSKPVSTCLKDLASNYASNSPPPVSPSKLDSVHKTDSITASASQNESFDASTSAGSIVASASGLEAAADREMDFISVCSSGAGDAASPR